MSGAFWFIIGCLVGNTMGVIMMALAAISDDDRRY